MLERFKKSLLTVLCRLNFQLERFFKSLLGGIFTFKTSPVDGCFQFLFRNRNQARRSVLNWNHRSVIFGINRQYISANRFCDRLRFGCLAFGDRMPTRAGKRTFNLVFQTFFYKTTNVFDLFSPQPSFRKFLIRQNHHLLEKQESTRLYPEVSLPA